MKRKQKIGQLFFSTMNHIFYDVVVYGFISPVFWKYNSGSILTSYHQAVTGNHLEIGVGTGYLLAKSTSQPNIKLLSLMDLNKHCLEKSARRLAKFKPDTFIQDITQPFSGFNKRVDSVGINFVLHCVPGDFKSKDVVFDHVCAVLNTGGTFFGSTLLSHGVKRTWSAKMLMRILNGLGIFFNQDDDLDDFSRGLRKRFANAEITTQGAVVIWRAVKE